MKRWKTLGVIKYISEYKKLACIEEHAVSFERLKRLDTITLSRTFDSNSENTLQTQTLRVLQQHYGLFQTALCSRLTWQADFPRIWRRNTL